MLLALQKLTFISSCGFLKHSVFGELILLVEFSLIRVSLSQLFPSQQTSNSFPIFIISFKFISVPDLFSFPCEIVIDEIPYKLSVVS